MRYDDAVRVRVPSSLGSAIEDVADRTDLSESEVTRRLIRLGLEDIEQIGDEALLAAVTAENVTV